MRDIASFPQLSTYRTLAQRIFHEGALVAGTKEIIDVTYTVDPYDPLFRFEERGLRMDYIAAELLWYLHGRRDDASIADRAAIWRRIFEEDGYARSNYGFWLFRKRGMARALQMLRLDPDTRRAVVFLNGNDDVGLDMADQPCTSVIQWMVRGRSLHAFVSMRSQDFIFGLGNDSPLWAFLTLLMARALEVHPAPVRVHVGSLHVYERHFPKLAALQYPTPIDLEWPHALLTPQEAAALIAGRPGFRFEQWLREQAS